MTIQKLKEEVKKLSPQEQLLFVQYVLGTLIGEADTPLSEDWKKEIDIRSEEYKNGEAKTRSWKELRKAILRQNM